MDTKIKCIIVDDELPGLNYLKMLCNEIPGLEVVKAYNDAQKLCAEKDDIDFDLCLLDIEMPGINGIELAGKLERPVIFTTAYKEYAADAFEVNAIDYLVKPINLNRLKKAIDKAINFLQQQQERSPQRSLLNTDRGKALIDFADAAVITTATTDPRDKLLQYRDGSTVLLKNISFESLRGLFPPGTFIRINKQQVIALQLVRFYTQATVSLLLPSGQELELSLSNSYRTAFVQAMA